MKPRLYLITNTENGSREDADLLAPLLAPHFTVRIYDPAAAAGLLAEADICLLRNLWPVGKTREGLKALAAALRQAQVPAYNPLRDDDFAQDKSYLAELTQEGLPVIPTALSKADASRFGFPARYLIKPRGGCSSEGVRLFKAERLGEIDITGHVIQPFVAFECEVSFFFIDDVFIYALRSQNDRWDLEPWKPNVKQVEWARQFVEWNELPYGLQRIDAALLPNGEMLLMEIEDLAPFLSLDRLPPLTRKEVAEKLAQSLLRLLAT